MNENRLSLFCELCVRSTCTCSCTAPPIVVDVHVPCTSVPDSRICTASTSTPTPPFLYQIFFLPAAGSVFRDLASHNSAQLVLQSPSFHCAIPHALVSTVASRQEGHSSPLFETVPWKVSCLTRCGPEHRHFPDSLLSPIWCLGSIFLLSCLSVCGLSGRAFSPSWPVLSSSPSVILPLLLSHQLSSFFILFFLPVFLWPFTFIDLVLVISK